LILALVPVALRGPRAGRKFDKVGAELGKAESVAEAPPAALPARHIVWRRIVGAGALCDLVGVQGGLDARHAHSTAHLGGRFSAKARRPSAASGLRRASANLSAAKSSTDDSGSMPTLWITALVAALANGAQRSICFSTSSSLASSAAVSFARCC